MYIIKIVSLTKNFDILKALDNINLEIKEGEIFSLLGPNGAGKTTLINILTTILKPTSGTAIVAGHNILENPLNVRRNIGIVFQEPSLDDLLTAEENLLLHGMMYGMKDILLRQRVNDMIKMVGLWERRKDIVRRFSGGMKRRLEIARGILHIPKVLFLDEPTLGLDPISRREIWEYIVKIKKENNITIILTTHYLEEADKISDRIAIINKGRIVELGTPYELKRKIGDEILKIKGDIDIKNISQLNFIKKISNINGYFLITAKELTPYLSQILKFAKNIEDIEIKKTSLDDVFLNITGKKFEELDE